MCYMAFLSFTATEFRAKILSVIYSLINPASCGVNCCPFSGSDNFVVVVVVAYSCFHCVEVILGSLFCDADLNVLLVLQSLAEGTRAGFLIFILNLEVKSMHILNK